MHYIYYNNIQTLLNILLYFTGISFEPRRYSAILDAKIMYKIFKKKNEIKMSRYNMYLLNF